MAKLRPGDRFQHGGRSYLVIVPVGSAYNCVDLTQGTLHWINPPEPSEAKSKKVSAKRARRQRAV